jgi:hypothetical protein
MKAVVLTDYEENQPILVTFGESAVVRTEPYLTSETIENEIGPDEEKEVILTELYDNCGELMATVKESPTEILKLLAETGVNL